MNRTYFTWNVTLINEAGSKVSYTFKTLWSPKHWGAAEVAEAARAQATYENKRPYKAEEANLLPA